MTDDPETLGRIRFQLTRLDPQPGDVLILTYPDDEAPDGEQAKLIASMISAKLPGGVDVILVPHGWKLELQQTYKLVKDRRVVVERESTQAPQRMQRPQPNGNGKHAP